MKGGGGVFVIEWEAGVCLVFVLRETLKQFPETPIFIASHNITDH